jgi:hypothetical protein
VLAADTATASTRLLAVADVICSAAGPPERWLARFPGCAVAVTTAGDQLLAATRAERPLRCQSITPSGRACDPMVIALFLHGWLAAGCTLSMLDPAHLEARTRLTRARATYSVGIVIEVR